MRFLFFGAGAIGTYFGGSLALNGHSVTFLERVETANELRQSGLKLEMRGETSQIPAPHLVTDLKTALADANYDCTVFAMKSFDTAGALANIAECGGNFPPVLCLQNGVENEGLIQERLGPGMVISASVTTAVGKKGVGSIRVERLRGIGIGDGHPLSMNLVNAFQGAGLNARLYPDGRAMKWSKLITNLLSNASSAILDMSPADIFSHPGLYALEIAQIKETLAVMKAQGIPVVDLPETSVKMLAFIAGSLPAWMSRPLASRVIGKGRGGKMPSFHIDLYSGRRPSEVDFLNGAVVRFGRRFNIPTPANSLLNETLMALTRGDIPLDTYARKPDQLLEAWAKLFRTR